MVVLTFDRVRMRGHRNRAYPLDRSGTEWDRIGAHFSVKESEEPWGGRLALPRREVADAVSVRSHVLRSVRAAARRRSARRRSPECSSTASTTYSPSSSRSSREGRKTRTIAARGGGSGWNNLIERVKGAACNCYSTLIQPTTTPSSTSTAPRGGAGGRRHRLYVERSQTEEHRRLGIGRAPLRLLHERGFAWKG